MTCKFCGKEKKFCIGDNGLLICSDCVKLCKILLKTKTSNKVIPFHTDLGA